MSSSRCNYAIVGVNDVQRACVCRKVGWDIVVCSAVCLFGEAYHCAVVVVVWVCVGGVVVSLPERALVVVLAECLGDLQKGEGGQG